MDNSAKFTNGVWELPPHARGVLREENVTRVPAGEPGLVQARQYGVKLADPKHPNKGWTRA